MNSYKNNKKIAEHILSVMLNRPANHQDEFLGWLTKNSASLKCVRDLSDEKTLSENLDNLRKYDKINSSKELIAKINKAERLRNKRRVIGYTGAAVAACVAILFISFQLLNHSNDSLLAQNDKIEKEISSKIKPVVTNDNAILVTQSGDRINLYNDMDAMIANASSKTDGKKSIKEGEPNQIPVNTIITPAGVRYTVTLSDGSKVQINENSRLSFPVEFVGDKREVNLEGEAYFEVAKNPKAPFIVNSKNNSSIKVLGTKFNISHSGSNTYTTLVEGSVEVQAGETKIIIKPSEQAITNSESHTIDVKEVDVTLYTAWKDGKFAFRDKPIHEIMERVSKWYNLTVEYDDEATESIRLSGSLRKYNTFREVIEIMEATNLIEMKIKDEHTIKIYKKKHFDSY